MKKSVYEKQLRILQTELCYLQDWIRKKGKRIIIVFEGRDAAGKGGTIRAITDRVSPRVFRKIALPAPSERERSQIYFQRYIQHFPAAGEIVIFDRSWYNRAGVEPVLGFCTKKEHRQFLKNCPLIEQHIVESGVVLIKYWLEVGELEQKRRFQRRVNDPLRQWKLSPTDLESRKQWYAYSKVRDQMFKATNTPSAPWYLIDSNNKRNARLNCIQHLLNQFPYTKGTKPQVELPERSQDRAYDDLKSINNLNWIPNTY